MEAIDREGQSNGAPELTELGKRIEMLRIHRGISKQHLARFADTSRQQLWRVMTGKSELTLGLRSRIAEALEIQPAELDGMAPTTRSLSLVSVRAPKSLADYLGDPAALTATLSSMPAGDVGRQLKRSLLDALEDAAITEALTLSSEFFELRRKVLSGEL
jgi:transcriptional regulator with XRE-family HTH domain